MNYFLQAFFISLIPAVAWGIMWFFVTKAIRDMEVFQSQFLFQLVGIPLLLLLLPFIPHTISTFNLPLLIGLGILETFVLTLYFYALKIGELAIVGPINNVNILITVCLAVVFLHDSIYPLKVFGIIAVLIGVILLGLKLQTIKKGVSLYKGVAPALLSTIGTGTYLFFVSISSRINGWYYTSLGIRVVMPITILAIFFIQKKGIISIFQKVPWKYVFLAAFFDVLAFSTFNFALTRYEVSYVAVISAATPIVSTLLAVIILKEKLKSYQIIGFFLVIVGIISLNLPYYKI